MTLVIGVAGGTGSGKTTIAQRLAESLPSGTCALLEHDAYYLDRSHLSPEQRAEVNYDHPDSLDNELLADHLRALKSGEAVEVPIYDFETHTRSAQVRRVLPARVVVVEGILVLADARIREQLDIKVYVDTAADIRVFRRIRRDIEQRGRSFASIRDQYYTTVRPMHLQFVAPSKHFADLVIPEGGENRVAIDVLLARLDRAAREDTDPPRSG